MTDIIHVVRTVAFAIWHARAARTKRLAIVLAISPIALSMSNLALAGTVTLPAGGMHLVQLPLMSDGNGSPRTQKRVADAGGPQSPTPMSTARVCVTKYNDLNGNGTLDTGEPGMAGWIFTVKNAAGAIVDFGVTDAQGHYCTSQALLPGAAWVIETPKPGWTSTDPGGTLPTKTMTLVAGQTWNGSFGNRIPPPMGQLCVAKYQDINSDGLYVSGEPLLPGWQFNLAGPSGPITLTTGTLGTACTPVNLLLGIYVITEVMQPGWSSIAPGGTSPQRTVTVAAGPNGNGVMFGNIHALPGQVCVNKYRDLNRNHTRNTGEPPLAGFTFEVRNASGVLVATGVTDAQGRYCTPANLPLGVYDVIEVPQPWWVSTDPNGPPLWQGPWHKTVTLVPGLGGELFFGNIKSGRACIYKYNDLNGNGHQDAGELPLAGWVFRFDYTSASTWQDVKITTDAAGVACVDLPPGPNLEVVEIPQPGWTSTDPVGMAVGSWAHKVFTVVEGQTTNLVFGNQSNTAPPGVICVTKYNDLNQNGLKDTGEPGLPGWVFNLKNSSGVAAGSLTTNALGKACMELPAGVYAAFEVTQSGWSNSDPSGAAPHKPFTVANNQTVNLVFGNYQPPILRFKKVVTSTAPGGGFPLTGLVFGNMFEVHSNCVLGNQNNGPNGQLTNVPANGTSPTPGYTGSSVGAVCTTWETPPLGLIAFAPCRSGQGHWETPLVSPLPYTIVPGMNEITVANRFVCDRPAATGSLTIFKKVIAEGAIPPPDINFYVDVNCQPDGPSETVKLNNSNGYHDTVAGIPIGRDCTITEHAPDVPADLAKRGCHWETSYPDDRRTPISSTEGARLTVVNRWICKTDTGTGTGVGPDGRTFDLSIKKSALSHEWASGSAGLFQLVVTNNGAALHPPVSIVVNDNLPSGMTLVGAAGSGWSCGSSSPLVCTYSGPVTAGQSLPAISVTAMAGKVGGATNCATVALNDAQDSVAGNDKDCVDIRIGKPRASNDNSVTPFGGSGQGGQGRADIGITKLITSGTTTVEGTSAFELTVTNYGAPFERGISIELHDMLPSGLMLLSATPAGSTWQCQTSGNDLACRFTGRIPGGRLPGIRVTARAMRSGTFNNCASISLIGAADTNTGNNTSCAMLRVGLDNTTPTMPPPLIGPPERPRPPPHKPDDHGKPIDEHGDGPYRP